MSEINPSTFPGLKPGVCSGLILSGAFDPILKGGVWRRRSINFLYYQIFKIPNSYLLMFSQKEIAGHPLWPPEYVLASPAHTNQGLSIAAPLRSFDGHPKPFSLHLDIEGCSPDISTHIFSRLPIACGVFFFPRAFYEAYHGIEYSI